jgi:hypothetical protein
MFAIVSLPPCYQNDSILQTNLQKTFPTLAEECFYCKQFSIAVKNGEEIYQLSG